MSGKTVQLEEPVTLSTKDSNLRPRSSGWDQEAPRKTLKIEEMRELLCTVYEKSGLKNTWKHTMNGAVLASGGTIVGGLVGGPLGLFVGATVGGLIAYWISRGKFKSILQILEELPQSEKQKLYNEAFAIIRCLDWNDAVHLTKLVLNNKHVQDQLLAVLLKHIKL